MFKNEDTIAAIATPVGRGGIGIIRISGSNSLEIARQVFKPKRPTNSFKSHHLYLGQMYDPFSNDNIDEILLSFMKAPHSYTREDVVEINSHSGYQILSRILRIIIDLGVRLAKPGEFTFRAFLNGRIDLTQAEAVIDLINSKSEKGLAFLSKQLQGSFRQKIDTIRQNAINILANSEVAIDFPEEADSISWENLAILIDDKLIKPLESLITAHTNRKLWVDGIKTVIVGRVNVGKSSLLNQLLDEQRSIVTPIPGTTRDVVESAITIGGMPLRLMDTAGLRKAKNEIEKFGVNLTKQKLSEADFVLLVIDQSRPLNQDDFNLIAKVQGKNTLIVINKIDLPSRIGNSIHIKDFSSLPFAGVSALTGQGLDQLRKAIQNCLLKDDIDDLYSDFAPNLRQSKAMSDSAQFFREALHNLKQRLPMEIIAVDLKSGLDALGEITGETTSEDILNAIFSQFCLGK
ncbi:MAG TPA: tRNA uridine-5-carboxymethylaminomethyl(34) synthesis GTPase MnmE [Desulfobacteraceae bacterium]|nr:tRNA uridine-5-carboxymethylaminomethyl(34) synthesis GTPase MnmE [Desulfobacteraceae bacterium]HPJ66540.1 tRNA uridine-5-carboxymethylaminomethyl(34) synthesis GTPase MnmE [Desulfobacteraceae bacterium]HPQ27494.1 tRNA uridine-5-carboxymethylaminomethyl(34) synthesis GTPase MnmE [Desulfobacteraceae bacterium]